MIKLHCVNRQQFPDLNQNLHTEIGGVLPLNQTASCRTRHHVSLKVLE